jgi:hypothetical protein
MDRLNVLGSRNLRTMPPYCHLLAEARAQIGQDTAEPRPTKPLQGDLCVGNLRIACASRGLAVPVTSSETRA